MIRNQRRKIRLILFSNTKILKYEDFHISRWRVQCDLAKLKADNFGGRKIWMMDCG